MHVSVNTDKMVEHLSVCRLRPVDEEFKRPSKQTKLDKLPPGLTVNTQVQIFPSCPFLPPLPQLCRFIAASNVAFSIVEHPEFKKLMAMLRPGYVLPTRKDIGGSILDEVFEQCLSEARRCCTGKVASMCADGWSNLSREVHSECMVF